MTRRLLALLLLVASPAAQEDGALLERADYAFPAWETAPGFTPGETVGAHVSRADYEAATRDTRYRMETLRYASDGLEVTAYLYGPVAGETRLPVVVFNRGSYVLGDVAPVHASLFHRLATEGYLVLAPMLRGSFGGEGHDEMGGDDVRDVLNVVPLLRELPRADPEQLYLVGESRGGMMTFQALRDGFPARAAVTWGAFTDLDALMAADASLLDVSRRIWPDLDARRAEIVARRSAVQWAEALEVPLLLLHGADDHQIPLEQSQALADLLKAQGTPCERLVLPGEDHRLSRNPEGRDALLLAWLERFSGRPLPPERTEFMGRKIARTMHWSGAEWLLRASREDEENASRFLEALAVQPGWTVADVGCGNGFHTLELARAVGPAGRVLAVDIQPEMLQQLGERAREAGLDSIRPILGSPHDPWLPPGSCDLVLMADVYHELAYPEPMLAAVRDALRPGGRLALLEFRAEDPSVPIKPLHRMTRVQVRTELEACGFVLASSFDELPWQHLLLFAPADAPGPSER